MLHFTPLLNLPGVTLPRPMRKILTFAAYEALAQQSPIITKDHLLLAACREARLKNITRPTPPNPQPTITRLSTLTIPLTEDAKHLLTTTQTPQDLLTSLGHH